ncbi:MAG TPA: DoxX family protein [Blastocatellia bacterium]|nr:DoxX family protein [Blastocatellia bacterium]
MDLGLRSIRANWAALPLELIAGVIFFAHGLQKLNDPPGYAGKLLGGIPIFLVYLVIAAEFGGGLLLLSGFLVRLGAFGHVCVMAVAVSQVHWVTGLTGPGGFEFPLALLASSIALLMLGPDPLSIDDNIGVSIYRSRDAAYRRESTDVGSPLVRAAGLLLILSGILVPLARLYLGIPDGTAPLVLAIIFGLASVASGAALVGGKPWAYIPAFIMARVYLAAGTLMLFYVKYTLRGIAAIAISLVMLAALRSARRGM